MCSFISCWCQLSPVVACSRCSCCSQCLSACPGEVATRPKRVAFCPAALLLCWLPPPPPPPSSPLPPLYGAPWVPIPRHYRDLARLPSFGPEATSSVAFSFSFFFFFLLSNPHLAFFILFYSPSPSSSSPLSLHFPVRNTLVQPGPLFLFIRWKNLGNLFIS